ncbi:sulfotransferase [Tamlana flava]|uniref:sulfotransferase n=1 Tax=Tamlana flava TaxID=3158572 RepID=UPI00351AD1E2
MSNNQKIVFLNSYFPRTGHNFASEVIKIFTNHQVLAHGHSETRLSNFLNKYDSVYQKIYHKKDQDFFNEIILSKIRESILSKSDSEYVMIKNTSFEGVNHLVKVFPDDIHILLIRNPKDVFGSIFKSMRFKKNNWKDVFKIIGKHMGLYPYFYSKKVSKTIMKSPPAFSKFYILRYEDLVNQNEVVLKDLKTKFNTPKSIQEIKKEINSIDVINSSFFEEIGAKNIWDSKKKTKAFKPVNRKSHSFLIRIGIIVGSRKLSKWLNYL